MPSTRLLQSGMMALGMSWLLVSMPSLQADPVQQLGALLKDGALESGAGTNSTEEVQAVSVSLQTGEVRLLEENPPPYYLTAPEEPQESTEVWSNIKVERFEGAFPNTRWRVFDDNGSLGGVFYWNDTNAFSYGGAWSAWPAANALNPAFYFYPNYMDAWMTYGYFSLRGAWTARLRFVYWNQSEPGFDYFWWLASRDGVNFYGYRVSGNSGGWRAQTLNLASVPGLGSCLGDGTVWIAFLFTSDGSIVDDGPFVDNVSIQAQY